MTRRMKLVFVVAASSLTLVTGIVFFVGYRVLGASPSPSSANVSEPASSLATFVEQTRALANTTLSSQIASSDAANLTESFARVISNKLIANASASGSNGSAASLLAPSTDALIDELLATNGKEIVFIPTLSQQDIIISPHRNRAAVTEYTIALVAILRSTAARMEELSNTSDMFDEKNLSALVADAQTAVNELAALPVPQPLSTFHQRELELAHGRLAIATALTHETEDPARALLAAHEWAATNHAFFDIISTLADTLPPGGLTP